MKEKLFSRDFVLVVLGQIISLFGNAAVRFALPLYLLNQTGSSLLYGVVTACAFVPSILLSPIGGIVADRVNKRNVMVVLDFFTAAVILAFSLLMGKGNLVVLLTATLMLLYGIAGAYQPSVQASVPALVDPEYFMQANSVINMISSLASLLGPVLGGIFYSRYGLRPVLWGCVVCFVLSAVMEIFIRIPFTRQETGGRIWNIVRQDFAESIHFIWREKPAVGRMLVVICGINFFLSSMIIVGAPYITTEVLDFGKEQANRLYGFAQGALAAGGLAGGICAGVFAKRFSTQRAGKLVAACAGCVFPLGVGLWLISNSVVNYFIMTVSFFAEMVFSTIFSVQMLSFVQREIPQRLMGKVIAVILTISMCAQPLGNALYGALFEVCRGFEYAVVLFAGGTSLALAVGAGNTFRRL